MKRIGILYHPLVERAYSLAQEMEKSLKSRGVSVWTCSAWEEEKACSLMDHTDLLLTSGGDGTILRAVQVALKTGTPVTGINLGRLGFMTEISANDVMQKVMALVDGKGWTDERAMLEATLITPSMGKPVETFTALNDVVVARGAIARLIGIEATINGEPLTAYRADGVIVATATGSTGYSLAAKGPILYPQSEDMLLVPVAPHLGLTYSLVLAPDSIIKLMVSTAHEATLSIDGHKNLPLANGSVIEVKRSAKKARFLRLQPRDTFFSTLEQRLKRNR
jgi:NAD+ kinase